MAHLFDVILIVALLGGVFGWCMTPFLNGVLWTCDVIEGGTPNWGWEVGCAVAVPFVWLFSIVTILIVYVW